MISSRDVDPPRWLLRNWPIESRADVFFFPRPCARPKPRFSTFSCYFISLILLSILPISFFYFLLFFFLYLFFLMRFAPMHGFGRVAIKRRDELTDSCKVDVTAPGDDVLRSRESRLSAPPDPIRFGKSVDLSRGRETDVRSADETFGSSPRMYRGTGEANTGRVPAGMGPGRRRR